MLETRKGPLVAHLPVALSLMLVSACVTLDESPSPAPRGTVSEGTIRVTSLPDGRLLLTFPPLPEEPSLQRFSSEDARRVLAQFHEDLSSLKPELLRRAGIGLCAELQGHATQQPVLGDPFASSSGLSRPSPMERTLREQFTIRYGEALFPLPPCLENSPLLMALRLSPRYMPQGMKEGFETLVTDPAFLASMVTALVLYGIAWAAPEPLFTKAFAASVTVVLLTLFSFAELTHFGLMAFRLYEGTRDARSLKEVEAASEHFGRYLGGAGLRILAFVAMRGVGKSVRIPQGGLGRLWPRRLALPGGYNWSNVTLAQANTTEGTLLVTGTVAGTASAALRSACKELPDKTPGYSRHHLATNKNDESHVRGGPWTPRFEKLFARAGMGLDDDANKVNLLGHFGPHPEEYHVEVFRRLEDALRFCKPQQQCRARLLAELTRIANEVCTPGTQLHGLTTKTSD
ncbi:putative lipoprotein [Cystobacter fuscus]|uniref:Putative lipoprotein n=1 Tax=Cystobacter fuscus TaxID=43 RepID=A0A250IYS7_9BACT|nr:AHH domain-containing protein [Cystobacter fuscus]ATB36382.1 putative lipoprotein [Cystobacter fuscus]